MFRRFFRWVVRNVLYNNNPFGAPRAFLRLQTLEDIIVPANVFWDGGASTLNWNDAANWSGDTKPGSVDDVFINQTGLTILYNTGTSVVKSVTTSSALNFAGGSLEINGDLQMNGASSLLAGGTLKNAVVQGSSGATFLIGNQGGTLHGVTIATGTVLDGTTAWPNYPANENWALVRGGLTVNGNVNLGANTGSAWGGLWFDETQTLGGTGKIVFGISEYNRLIARNHNTTLTLAAGLTIEGQKGKIEHNNSYNSTESIINNATINIASGGSLWFGADNWVNNGSITVPNGYLTLGGSFTTAAIGNLNAAGTEVYLTGVLTNTSNTLTFKPEWGTWILWNGTIQGGTLTQTNNSKLRLSNQGGLFNGVTIAAGLTVDGTTAWANYPSNENHAAVRGGLTVNGIINLGANTGSAWGGLWFDETQTVGGTGKIVFGISEYNRLIARNHNTTLTLAAGFTIEGQKGKIDQDYGYQATERIINNATINMANGGSLWLSADNWVNNGSITVPNGYLTLGGSFTTAAIGNLNATGTEVYLTGVLTNTSNTLTLKPEWGNWILWSGTIQGGTLTQINNSKLRLSNQGGSLLGGVTIAAGFTLDGTTAWPNYPSNENHAAVRGGLTVNGTINLGGTTGSAWGGLWFDETQTLGGTGKIVFGISEYNRLIARNHNTTLTLAAGFTIEGQKGKIDQDYGYQATERIINNATINMANGGSLWFSADNWVNNGSITVPNGYLTLGGSFTTAAIGNLNATGTEVYLTGVLTNTSNTLTLKPEWGNWILWNGAIDGGTLTQTGNAKLRLSNQGGRLLGGITLASGFTLDGTTVWTNYPAYENHAAVAGGLIVNGTINLGASTGSAWGGLWFDGTQTVGGTGQIVFGPHTSNSLLAQGNGTTVTLGSGLQVRGGYANIYGAGSYNSVELIDNASNLTMAANGRFNFQNLTLSDAYALDVAPSGKLGIRGDLLATLQTGNRFAQRGTVVFYGSGTAANPQRLEVISQNNGGAPANFGSNFSFNTIQLQNNTRVQLVDLVDNMAGSGAEALYADTIIVPAGTTLDLNGITVYARITQIAGTVLNGSITIVPDGGGLAAGVPASGKISVAGQTDDWTIPVIAGQTLLVQLNSGDGTNVPPATPVLSRGGFDILDPQGNVLATQNATQNGQFLSVRLNLLPAAGNYTIRVRASTSLPNATGNYQITARVAFIDTAPLPLGQVRTGQIESEASLDQWMFSGAANQQLRLDVLGTTAPVRFRLTGPNGWIGFTDLTTDSDPVTLPANGDYTLEVDGPAGAYSFTLNELVPTAIALGTPLTETLAGTNAAKLYQFTTTTNDPLRVRLTANTATDQLELYLRRGAPPTRKDFDLRSVVSAATQVVEVPTASPDTWYVLVYSTQATAGNTYTLTATSSPVFANSLTPTRSATGLPTTLTLTGAGFVVGTAVELVAGATVIPTTVSIDAFDRLTASVNLLGVNAGSYDVRVRRPDNATDTLPGAFTVTAAGQAQLETRLILPSAFGRHATATLFLEYENTGNAAMPAPILIVQSGDADGSDKPLLTLDQANLTQGFWTSATPDGFAHSVQIYATGAQPGVLLPGELVRVPIYYAGLLTPWDFSDSQVEMEVRVHEAGNTEAIDWNSLKPTLQPAGMNAETWDAVFANLQAHVGPTWGDYVRRLGDLATALDRLGRKVTNVAELFAFQSLMANGLPVTPTLAAAVDGAVPSPGMTIAFGRSFGNTIQERYAVGPFGRGWSLGWNVYAETLADGTVIVHEAADRQRRYQPDSRSTTNYFSQEGDTATLKKLAGGILQLTDSGGSVLRFLATGQLDYMQDVNSNRITAGYAAGRLTSLTHSAGGSLLITYNTAGRITSLAESTGNVTTFAYDPSNEHLLSATSPQGTIHYTYDTGTNLAKRHALTSVTDANGVVMTFVYDNAGRLNASEQTGGLQRTTYSYDAVGRVLLTDAAGVTARLAFDHRGRLARSEDSSGDYLRYDYDADGFLRTQTDSLGRTQTYNWCGCGSLLSVTDPLGATTSFAKGGPNNQPLSFTDAKGNVTAYQYDTEGNRTRTTYADGTSEAATYTAAGLLASITNRRSQTVQMSYNGFGQVTSETYPDNSTTTYTYDAQQRLHTATDADGTITFTYDTADRVTHIAFPGSRWLSFVYDAGGRRTQMTDHTGFVTKYGYDAAGRLVTLQDATDTVLVSYVYDVAGRLIREDKSNGTVTTNDFDTLGRLQKITNMAPGGAVNSFFEYGYDSQGRRTSMATADGTWTYTYDVVGQLTRAVFASTNGSIPSQDYRYEFDLLGNRTRTIVNGLTTMYAGNAMNQYTSVGSTTYTYDLDGNVIAENGPGGTKTFTYDVLNRLTRVETPTSVTTYEYDLFGHRTATVVDGVRTEYLIDPFGMGDVVGEYNGSGVRQASYTRGLGLEAVQGTSGLNFYDFDALGSTSGVTSTAGNYVDRYAYDPFGGSLFRSETTNNAFEYIGQYGVTTEANGLHFMRARFYDAATGRFNSQDPLRLGGGVNMYAYAFNRPTTLIDPEGLAPRMSRYKQPIPTRTRVRPQMDPQAKQIDERAKLGEDLAGMGQNLVDAYSHADRAIDAMQMVLGTPGYSCDEIVERRVCVGFDGYDVIFQNCQGNGVVVRCPGDRREWRPPEVPSNVGTTGGTSTANSVDPNEKFGAAGVGSQAFIGPNATIPYRINFENLGPGSVPPPTTPATAPAQRVEITDQLSANLDWNSVEFTGFGYGDTEHAFDGKAPFQAISIPMTYNGATFNVDVEMSIEPTTGLVRVIFQSVDPLTFLPPDVLAGFLPPEDGTGRGKGYMTFNAKPKAGLATGTEIRNVALIRFDGQTVIATNQIDPQDASAGTDPHKEARNTIDATPPTASINLVPQYSKTKQFTVSWGGSDGNGAGIATFDVYFAIDGGPWQMWRHDTTDGSALFTGELGKTYNFVAVGKDLVGNEQAIPTTAQATVRVGVTPTAVDDAFVVTRGKEFKGTVATNDARSKQPAEALVVTEPTQGTLTLNPNGTFVYVPNETSTGRDFFTYRWSNTAGTSNSARVDLATHLVSFSKPKVSVSEKKASTTLTVTLNTPATETLSVNYVVTPATAQSSDYTLASGLLTFEEGERTKTLTVTIHDDAFDEANETLQVWLTATSGAVAVGKNRTATVTITDDDATPKVSFRHKTGTGTESSSSTVEVFLSAPSGQPVTVTYGLLKASTATKDGDFTLPTTMQLTFQPGETSKVIPLTVLDDLTEEADETVVLRLLKATNAKIAGNPTHTHTIQADDPQRTVSFQTSSTTVTEGVTTISIVVQLSSAAAFNVKVNYAIDATGLTATAKKDFILQPGTLTFKPGETEKTIVIRVLDDAAVEPTETLTVRLNTPTNAALGPIDAFALTLNDNET